jgi:hypothetical protein
MKRFLTVSLAFLLLVPACGDKDAAFKKNIGKTAVLRSWGGRKLYVYLDPEKYHEVSAARMSNDTVNLSGMREREEFYPVEDQTRVLIRNYGQGCYYLKIMSGDHGGDLVVVPVDYVKLPE